MRTRDKDRWRQAVMAKLLAERPADLDPLAGGALRHTLQLTSFGGSGTTALAEHLARYGADLPASAGHFPFKHLREPPAPHLVPQGFRAVYLHGDPRDAVVSVFRRDFQFGHYAGMHLREPDADASACLASLDTFLEAGVDDFQIADHVERWLSRTERTYPVLVLRFDALESVWPEVRSFARLAPDAPPLAVGKRRSDWRSLPEPQRTRIDAMYGAVAERLAALAPTELR